MGNSAKNGFKIINRTAFILKIITILIVIVTSIGITVWGIQSDFKNKEIEGSQVVAEIEYTDDVKEISDLELLKNTFKIEIYDDVVANNNILEIMVFSTIILLIKFILIIGIFDGVEKLFGNLYKSNDGIITDKNAKILRNVGIIAILRIIIPSVINIITKYMLSSTTSGKITWFDLAVTVVIAGSSLGMYFIIRQELLKNKIE